MKKLIAIIFTLVLILPFCSAVDVEAEQNDMIGTSELEEAVPIEARDLMGDISISDSFNFGESVMSIVSEASNEVRGIFSTGLKKVSIIIAIVMLCAVLGTIGGISADTAKYVTTGAVLAITVVSIGDVNALVGLAGEAMDSIAVFSRALLPTMAAALVASGKPISSSALYVATTVFADFLVTISNSLIMPLIYAYIAVCVANAIIGNDTLGRIASLLKWVVSTALKIIVVVFIAFTSLTGVISGSADTATIKAAKLALSSVVPVVGSLIADASETVIVSAGIIKNSVGIFGILCVLAITILPFLQIGIEYLLYKAAAALAGAIGGGAEVKLIDNISTALSMILGMAGTCAIIVTVACVAMLRVVTG